MTCGGRAVRNDIEEYDTDSADQGDHVGIISTSTKLCRPLGLRVQLEAKKSQKTQRLLFDFCPA